MMYVLFKKNEVSNIFDSFVGGTFEIRCQNKLPLSIKVFIVENEPDSADSTEKRTNGMFSLTLGRKEHISVKLGRFALRNVSFRKGGGSIYADVTTRFRMKETTSKVGPLVVSETATCVSLVESETNPGTYTLQSS